jgi:hypothetical protein
LPASGAANLLKGQRARIEPQLERDRPAAAPMMHERSAATLPQRGLTAKAKAANSGHCVRALHLRARKIGSASDKFMLWWNPRRSVMKLCEVSRQPRHPNIQTASVSAPSLGEYSCRSNISSASEGRGRGLYRSGGALQPAGMCPWRRSFRTRLRWTPRRQRPVFRTRCPRYGA